MGYKLKQAQKNRKRKYIGGKSKFFCLYNARENENRNWFFLFRWVIQKLKLF